jgi:hypothetical protein
LKLRGFAAAARPSSVARGGRRALTSAVEPLFLWAVRMAKATRPVRTTRRNSRSGESQHSHFEYGSTRGQWDREAATDFAITTVNVPDRLDTQELRARSDSEAAQPSVSRFHRADVARVFKGLFLLALLAALAWGAMRMAAPLREAVSPAGVQAQMSRALGVPVTVRNTELRFWPSPRLVISDMTVQSGFSLPEVAVHFNWRDAAHGLKAATWVLGEARVAPLTLSGQQALSMLNSIRGASALPPAVSTVRFESVEFADLALMPGRYEAVVRRGVTQREFSSVSLKRLGGDGQLDVEIVPPPAAGGEAKFALFATKWAAPAGPGILWNEATARGEFRADAVRVDSYSVGAGFGNLSGAALLARQGNGWRLSGNLRSPDLSVDELIRFLAGTGGGAPAGLPLRGTAKFDLVVAGNGVTVDEALRRATASGRMSIAGATLAGANLGLAATQGDLGGSGSFTRFTDLEFDAIVSNSGLAVRNVTGRAGSLRVSGGFSVDRSLQVSGTLVSEVASPRGTARSETFVAGTASAPSFQ